VDWLTLLSSAGAAQTILNIVLQTRTVIIQCFGVRAINSVSPIFTSLNRSLLLTYNIDTIYQTNLLGQLVNSIT
jgi:hypothetical protein